MNASTLSNQKKNNYRQKNNYRVVIVHPSAGANWSGGTENFAIELTNRLSPYFDVELLAGAPCSPYYYPSGGMSRVQARKLIKNPFISSFLKRFSTHPHMVIEHATNFFPCAWRLLTKPADLVFPCNDYGGLAMAAFVRKFKGTPVLFKSHNGLLAEGKPLARAIKFKPDHLVIFSQAMANFASQVRPDQSMSLIPNGVDLDKFKPEGKAIDPGLPKPLALCIASLNRRDHKRVELILQAMAKLPEVSLLIAGDGPDREYYQAMGDRLLGSHRFAIGTFPFEQMPEVYRCADLFTLPSIDEPFSNAYLQALASGLPVVTTDDEIRNYMVGDAGIMCDVTDPDIYAKAIAEILKGGDWQSKARENSRRFSWEQVAASYRDLIMEMIAKSKGF